jgi:glutathione S-transferase
LVRFLLQFSVRAAARRGSTEFPVAATLTISSRNYSSWSLRGWLICRMAGLEFDEVVLPPDDPSSRAELLHLSPSFLVPRLTNEGMTVWDALAIAEYLNELKPGAGILPRDPGERAHCRSICAEMHGGFMNLRSALPMNLKARHPGFRIWAGAQSDIDRVKTIWRDCLAAYGGPFLFGELSLADAMYAPVCTRFVTYEVALDRQLAVYRGGIMDWSLMREWIAAARNEPDEIEELEVEF